jgi:ribosome-associated protein
LADAPEPIRLDQFLKFQGLVGTGGEAKQRIQGGEVRVNGFQETRRGRQLKPGDRVLRSPGSRVSEAQAYAERAAVAPSVTPKPTSGGQ